MNNVIGTASTKFGYYSSLDLCTQIFGGFFVLLFFFARERLTSAHYATCTSAAYFIFSQAGDEANIRKVLTSHP